MIDLQTLTYHKIDTLYHRDPDKKNIIIPGQYANPACEFLLHNEWQFTEKIDGTNIRLIYEAGNLTIKGRKSNSDLSGPIAKWYQENMSSLLEKFTSVFGDSSAIVFGEGYGNGIQSGGNYGEPSFIVFDVLVPANDDELIDYWWLKRESVEDIAEGLGLDIVPKFTMTLHEAILKVEKGMTSQWGNFIAEGLVGIPAVPLLNRNGSRIVTKIKHRDFVQLHKALSGDKRFS